MSPGYLCHFEMRTKPGGGVRLKASAICWASSPSRGTAMSPSPRKCVKFQGTRNCWTWSLNKISANFARFQAVLSDGFLWCLSNVAESSFKHMITGESRWSSVTANNSGWLYNNQATTSGSPLSMALCKIHCPVGVRIVVTRISRIAAHRITTSVSYQLSRFAGRGDNQGTEYIVAWCRSINASHWRIICNP